MWDLRSGMDGGERRWEVCVGRHCEDGAADAREQGDEDAKCCDGGADADGGGEFVQGAELDGREDRRVRAGKLLRSGREDGADGDECVDAEDGHQGKRDGARNGASRVPDLLAESRDPCVAGEGVEEKAGPA